MKYAAQLFFWLLLVSHIVKDYLVTVSSDPIVTESFFPLIESFQFPIVFFTLLSLYGLAYNKKILGTRKMRIAGGMYLLNALYLLIMPIIFYWDQSSDITIDLIVFFMTDFWIFYILWRNKNVVIEHA